jgi:hypothetical protein
MSKPKPRTGTVAWINDIKLRLNQDVGFWEWLEKTYGMNEAQLRKHSVDIKEFSQADMFACPTKEVTYAEGIGIMPSCLNSP